VFLIKHIISHDNPHIYESLCIIRRDINQYSALANLNTTEACEEIELHELYCLLVFAKWNKFAAVLPLRRLFISQLGIHWL
jgi:hypothetical protein